MPNVLNKHTCKSMENSVYIGRPTKYGNPFKIGRDGTRNEVIEKYKNWLFEHPELIESAKRELAGKNLICSCAPQACHGDILLVVANS